MTMQVDDEVLGRFARQQHDLFERVRKGALDPEAVYQAVKSLLKQGRKVGKKKSRSISILQLLTPGLIIPATSGQRTLAKATDIFMGGIYGESCDVPGQPRPETLVDVYEQMEDATFRQMFKRPESDLNRLFCLDQDQIIEFVLTHREHLHPQGSTFFPFNMAGDSLVARVHWFDARWLKVHVDRFAFGIVWDAGNRYRVVLPQLALEPS